MGKGKLAAFWVLARGKWGSPVQRPTPPVNVSGQESLCRRERLHAATAQSVLRVILVVLSTVSLQVLGQCVPISLRPALGVVAAHVTATIWSSWS